MGVLMEEIEEVQNCVNMATAAVNKWEKESIATTDIDGPLSIYGKKSLIKTIAELLAMHANVVKAEEPLEQPLERPRAKVGRPRNVDKRY